MPVPRLNGLLVGSVMGVTCEELYGSCKPFLVLENMIVDRKYRNKGVGKALISEIEKIAAETLGYSPNTHKGFKKKLI